VKDKKVQWLILLGCVIVFFPGIEHWTDSPRPPLPSLLSDGLYELLKVAATGIFAALLIEKSPLFSQKGHGAKTGEQQEEPNSNE
jgi:hypothetical protein